jgi:pilus assembly protein CpaB
MKSKTVILMVVAVTCGLGASYMTSRLLAERNNDRDKEEEKVKILVARKSIPQGTFIKNPEDWFIEKEFTLGEEPKKAVRTFDEIKDRVVSKPLSAEQWVISDDLLRKEQSGLAFALPKGMRAVAIRVNVDTVVAGFVQPNSRVDVVNTVRQGEKDSYSQTILQNMLVLAIDTIDSRDLEKKAIVSSTVTLAVTPDEAQALSLAQTMGELRLSLRPQDDNETTNVRTLRPEDLKNGRVRGTKKPGETDDDPDAPRGSLAKVPDVAPVEPTTPTPEPTPEPVKKKKPWTLTILNGDQQARAQFTQEEDGEIGTVIQKSDLGSRPNKTAPAPEKGPAPDKGGPTTAPLDPEKPKVKKNSAPGS